MKNLKKYLFIISTICLSVLGTSCTESVEYTQADKVNGEQVYFPNTIPAQINLDRDKTTHSIQLMRINKSGALTLELKVESETDKLHFPSSVEFADGSNTASIDITYSLDELGYDKFYNATISLTDENVVTQYGASVLKCKIGIPAPWVTMKGKATYIDDILFSAFGLETPAYQVDIQQNEANKNLYRVVNPFGENYPAFDAIAGQYDTSKDYYLEFNVENPDAVILNLGEIGVMDPELGMLGAGTLTPGTFKDDIITFPVRGLALAAGSDVVAYANNNGAFKLALPGVELKDYALSAEYAGKQLASDGKTEGIVAKITSLGADVEKVNVAIVLGNDEQDFDTDELLKQSVEVAVSGLELPAAVTVPFKDKETGFYTIVAMASAGGEVRTVSTSVFKYNQDIKEEWVDRYIGTYNFTNPVMVNGGLNYEEGLTMSQNKDNPSKWRISGSEYIDELTFTYDEESNQIVVDESSMLGGQLYVENTIGAAGNHTGDTFTFKLKYYSAYGVYGDFEETFVITGYPESSKNKNMKTASFIHSNKSDASISIRKSLLPSSRKISVR